MEEKDIINLDLEMKLINKRPIFVYLGCLYPPTLNEITDMGLSIYNTYITLICSTFDELKQYELLGESKVTNVYDWLCEQCLMHKKYELYILNGFAMFFREKVSFNGYYFHLGENIERRYITEENFNYIQSILRKMCCMEDVEEEQYNPANEKVRQLLEKKKKYREKLKKLKQNEDGESLNLADLISVYCGNGNGVNVLTVGEYSMYQFNDQFNRMTMLQDYNVNIQALVHGADNKDELKSWMRKIKAED